MEWTLGCGNALTIPQIWERKWDRLTSVQMMPDLIATFAREMSVKVMGWELLNVAMLGLMWVLGFVDVGEAMAAFSKGFSGEMVLVDIILRHEDRKPG